MECIEIAIRKNEKVQSLDVSPYYVFPVHICWSVGCVSIPWILESDHGLLYPVLFVILLYENK